MGDSLTLRLEVEDISRNFGGVRALSRVSAVLEGPGVIGIIGPNGSGKSTLLGIVSGFLRPTTGIVRLNGADVTRASASSLAHRGLARTFQQIRLVPNLRAWENIAMGIRGASFSEKAVRSEVRRIAVALDLVDVLGAWPEDLPAAIQRKVQIASALVGDPKVLLLDEPAAGLTDREANVLVRILREVGKTALVVIVEHNMQVIYGCAERVLVLLDGHLVLDAPPQGVKDDPVVREAYLGLPAPAAQAT